MTSSGTYSFSVSIGEAVIAAFERCGIRTPEIRQEHMLTARRETNFLFSEFSNRQVNLWKVTLYSQLLTAGTATYTLGNEIVMILDGYRSINQGLPSQTDIYLTPISRTTYDSFPQKQTQGPPTVYWLNRQIIPNVTFWPVPDSGGPYYFNYHAVIQVQDAAIGGGQTPDIPERWYDVFIAGLAFRLCRVYKPELRQALKGDYDEAWTIAAAQDVENTPLLIAPNLARYYR